MDVIELEKIYKSWSQYYWLLLGLSLFIDNNINHIDWSQETKSIRDQWHSVIDP